MRNFTLYDMFARNAVVYADATALVFGEQRISFAQLAKRVEVFSAVMASKGVGKGDRVAAISMNHPDFFALIGAASRLGAILVPLNWRLSEGELVYILQDTTPRLLFCDSHFAALAKVIGSGTKTPVVHLAFSTEPDATHHLEFVGNVSRTTEDDPLCIIYTAAVDGYPRGATLSNRNLLSANLQVIAAMRLSHDDVHLAMLPLFHITGMNLALAVMQVGGRNVVIEKFSEEQVAACSSTEKITLWGSFPPILQRMRAEIAKNEESYRALKYVVGIDGPDNIKAFEELVSARFWILYGQSETSGFVTFGQASNRLGTAGPAGLLSHFAIVDDGDQPVAAGEVGEIVVRGPLVFQGYWRLDEVNRKTFRNGWHHTGDLGLLDDAGHLVYKGRKPEKELIKPGGENVYPAEVERVILEHPEVERVVVFGVPDPKFGEGVKAVCVKSVGSELTEHQLIAFVGERIARYKKPGYVEFVDALPLLAGGVDRQKVKQLYGGGTSS